jgi:hypothetical protein
VKVAAVPLVDLLEADDRTTHEILPAPTRLSTHRL